MFSKRILVIVAVLTALVLTGCAGRESTPSNVTAILLVNPGKIQRIQLVTGQLLGNPVFLSANIREITESPTSGQVLGLSDTHMLYAIDTATGTCTQISSDPLNGINDAGMALTPDGTVVRIGDHNTGNNYRVSPNTGDIVGQDTKLQYVAGDAHEGDGPPIAALTYTSGANPKLYGFDGLNDDIFQVTDIPGGKVSTVGSFGSDLSCLCGMTYNPADHMLYVVAEGGTSAGIYRVDPTTAASVRIGGTELGGAGIALEH